MGIKRSASTISISSSEGEVVTRGKGKGKAKVPATPTKKVKKEINTTQQDEPGTGEWVDWPAPRDAMERARAFIRDIAENQRTTLLVPDKDADGLSSSYILHHSLLLLGLPASKIHTHLLSKGANVHSPAEREKMEEIVRREGVERCVVMDQGSRGGVILDGLREGVLIIDHHQSTEFPPGATVLTACNSSPIATTSLLTHLVLTPLHPSIRSATDWAALIGMIGDLGAGTKWGTGPWPGYLGETQKKYGAKLLGEAVSQINAPRRTAEYNVPKAYQTLITSTSPRDIASNAYLKLCRLDVNVEIEKWARTAPRFSGDGKVVLIRVESGFQIHPVIATRWAGTLRKAKTLVMIMCANSGFNPDPNLVSFSCRISSSLRSLPDSERPDLISLLNSYASTIPDFHARVGENFARGHKEATGGIIPKEEFALLLEAMGVDESPKAKSEPGAKGGKKAKPEGGQKNGIMNYFKVQDGAKPKGKEEAAKVEE